MNNQVNLPVKDMNALIPFYKGYKPHMLAKDSHLSKDNACPSSIFLSVVFGKHYYIYQ